MAIIGVLLVLSLIGLFIWFINNVKILNHFKESLQDSQAEKTALIIEIMDKVDKLENVIRIELLLLQAEGQFTKPVFTNMLNGIKAKLTNKQSMTLKELQNVAVELSDLENNIRKGKK